MCVYVFLTTVEMLPVFLREAPLLALLCASDRLRREGGGVDSKTPVSHSGKVSEKKNQTFVRSVCLSLKKSQPGFLELGIPLRRAYFQHIPLRPPRFFFALIQPRVKYKKAARTGSLLTPTAALGL